MEEFQLESLIELNKHGERLLAGMYDIIKSFGTSEFQSILTSEVQKKFRPESKKIPQAPRNLKSGDTYNTLQRPYTILAHFRQFQALALKTLQLCKNQTPTISFVERYPLTLNLIQLYNTYVKLHILLTQYDDFTTIVNLYRWALEAVSKGTDPNGELLDKFLHERSSVKSLESELQFLNEPILNLLSTFTPSIVLIIGHPTSNLWDKLTLSEEPKYNNSDTFLTIDQLTMIHLREICDFFLCFGFVSMQSLNQQLGQAFQLIYKYCLSIQLCGDIFIELKTLWNLFKKNKKLEFDTSFVETAESDYSKIRPTQENKRLKISVLIRDFISASEVDASLLSTKFGVAFSLLGFAGFEIKNAFRIKATKPNLPSSNHSISELVYLYGKLTVIYLKSIPDIQRFVIYNIREFDAPYIDTLAHSFTLSQSIYDQLTMLIAAMRTIDIAQYDQGTTYDLSKLLGLIYSLFTAFGRFSINHGASHLVPLLRLLSGVYFRMNLFQNTFLTILQISKISTFWAHINQISEYVGDTKFNESCYNIGAILLVHYCSMDNASISEIRSLPSTLKNHYQVLYKTISNSIRDLCDELQNEHYAKLRKQMLANNLMSDKAQSLGNESSNKARKEILPIASTTRKIGYSMMIAQEIGVVNICGEEHNLPEELRKDLQMYMVEMFSSEHLHPPVEVIRELQTARWIMQVVCSSGAMSLPITLYNSYHTLSDGVESAFVKMYRNAYSGVIVNKLIPISFYSNSQDAFLPMPGKDNISPAQYISEPAFQSLQALIGKEGCSLIIDSINNTIGEKIKQLAQTLNKLSNSVKSEVSYPSFNDPEGLLHNIITLGSILQVRSMINEYTTNNNSGVKPHLDNNFMNIINESLNGIDLFGDSNDGKFKFLAIIASLFSLQYWECFDYDASNDAIKDNSHLISRVLDVFIAYALYQNKIKAPADAYAYFFTMFAKSIQCGMEHFKSNKKVNYPGSNMLILADLFVRCSDYADYGALEQAVSYQLIRSIYATILMSGQNNSKKAQDAGEGKSKK
ncbi:hypothetical protein GPJ56_005822 [Histomonas meleagridis]|uniref:uncharacterized protein n=1 Tax=Histomonas meleagridis TaxID=135588 RepID=UPI003559B063|nr:hypothetical protein GPJ56_005822 [Histomonas meleagridis]KAH0798642.1 hypothetical protein GO595_008507 [Histomonas meleagridis]